MDNNARLGKNRRNLVTLGKDLFASFLPHIQFFPPIGFLWKRPDWITTLLLILGHILPAGRSDRDSKYASTNRSKAKTPKGS